MSELIKINNLNVATKTGAPLLKNVSLDIHPGEITLLAGGSGSGKTVFMKILAGLMGSLQSSFQISGSVTIDGKEILKKPFVLPRIRRSQVGIVFQDFGLFDNYSLKHNLDFAFAHSPFKMPRQQKKNTRARLQSKLGLSANLSIKHASGGQKRRMAIARTLAYNPEIIIYDEPTAGLDPEMAKTVAQLVQTTHQEFSKKSSIVVTHQYEDFLPFVDRIFFIDPDEKNISEVNKEELREISSQGKFQVPTLSSPPLSFYKKLLSRFFGFFEKTTHYTLLFITFFVSSLFRLLPIWRSPVWGLRFFAHYFRLVSFLSAMIYIGMAGIIIGFVGGYFTFEFLPYRHVTERLIKDDFLMALGYGLYRIIIPILTAILIAARCGAAVTSDLGNRVYLQEIDAIKSLGASPASYFQTSIVYSFLIGTPLLTFIAFVLAKLVCLSVFLFMDPSINAVEADAIFHRRLRMGGSLYWRGTHWVVYKQLVCGFGLANICYFIGIRPKSSTRDISRDITQTVIWGTIFVLLTHLVFALLEFPEPI